MKNSVTIVCGVMLVFLAAVKSLADPQADAIMRASYSLPEASTMQSTMYMLIVDRNGTQSLRALDMYSRQGEAGRDSFIEFTSPATIAGTRFLTLANRDADDDQWVWLPDLKKVRRIAASGRGASFFGSDLTYYDMSRHRFEDSRYNRSGSEALTVVRDAKQVAEDCHIIDSTPVDPSMPYGRARLWVGKDDSYVYKSVMWTTKGELVKTVYILEVQTEGGVIVPLKTAVVAADGHKTLLQMAGVRLGHAVDDRLFSVQNLSR